MGSSGLWVLPLPCFALSYLGVQPIFPRKNWTLFRAPSIQQVVFVEALTLFKRRFI